MNRTIGWSVAATSVGILVILGLGFLLLIYSGAYNVAATEPDVGPMEWALETTMENSIRRRAGGIEAPPPVDSAAIQHGFVHFRAMCVVCHGAPGVERGEFGQGLTPTPPRLGRAVRQWSDAELFWILKHGIKMTGMPAFGPTHSDEELWGIVAYIRTLPEVTTEEYERQVEALGETVGETPAGHSHAPGTPDHSH